MRAAALAAAWLGFTASCGLSYMDHAVRKESPKERALLAGGMSAEEMGTANKRHAKGTRAQRKIAKNTNGRS